MSKFEKVAMELSKKTFDTDNSLILLKGAGDSRFNGKFHSINSCTLNVYESYKSLNEIIKKFDLNIKKGSE